MVEEYEGPSAILHRERRDAPDAAATQAPRGGGQEEQVPPINLLRRGREISVFLREQRRE